MQIYCFEVEAVYYPVLKTILTLRYSKRVLKKKLNIKVFIDISLRLTKYGPNYFLAKK